MKSHRTWQWASEIKLIATTSRDACFSSNVPSLRVYLQTIGSELNQLDHKCRFICVSGYVDHLCNTDLGPISRDHGNILIFSSPQLIQITKVYLLLAVLM